jgi:hypothetical protein
MAPNRAAFRNAEDDGGNLTIWVNRVAFARIRD